ncbi:MAG TPA: oligosaccharide flippase family protein [Kofleriaceae bacterium]|nr:oligosaccharide flippase family protein [Kofleriaceae bacterium]
MSEQPPLRESQKRMATNVNRGLAWIGVASSLVAILDLAALLIILNTWVDETEYGIVSLAAWIYPILDQATDLGLSAAVVQRDDHDDAKLSTVFWINLITAGFLFAVLLAFAPPVMEWAYGHAVIGWLLVAYGSKLLWQNVYFMPVALMKRELRFKELSIIRIFANVAEFLGKVGFAWAGFGLWCFVLGPLCRVFVTGIGAQICHPWRPKLIFRFREAREYVTFGLQSSGSQILYHFYTNIHLPIVGAFFGVTATGYYRLASEIVLEPIKMISNVIVDIAFPAFARLRHTRDRLIAQLVSFTKLNLITVMMYSAIVFVAADDVIAALFPAYGSSPAGEPSIAPASDAVRLMAAVAILRSVALMIPPLLDGVGYPNRTFVYTLTASIALPLSFIAGAALLGDTMGYLSVAVAWAIGYPVAFAVLIWLAAYTLSWTVGAYLRAISGVALCMIAAAVIGIGPHYVMAGVPAGLRLLITSVVIVGVTAVLLAYTQGLSLRTAVRALKGDPQAALSSPALEQAAIEEEARAAEHEGR